MASEATNRSCFGVISFCSERPAQQTNSQFVMNDAEHIKNWIREAPPWCPCVLREVLRRHIKIKQNITHCRVDQFRTPCRYISSLEHL